MIFDRWITDEFRYARGEKERRRNGRESACARATRELPIHFVSLSSTSAKFPRGKLVQLVYSPRNSIIEHRRMIEQILFPIKFQMTIPTLPSITIFCHCNCISGRTKKSGISWARKVNLFRLGFLIARRGVQFKWNQKHCKMFRT